MPLRLGSNKWIYVLAALISILWVVFTWKGLTTAIEIWYISEIFNHCFIVLPACLYLVWEKRKEIPWHCARIEWWLLPVILMQLLLYLFGYAGDINLFMHVATFSMLLTITWFLLGNIVAKHMVFPLFFILFSIPVGEELVPYLQEIAADFSVMLLEASGVPVFKNGLYIEIPEGKFLVAEACSGISFLIASIVLGNLYAYLNLKRLKTRLLFVALSIVFPVVANVIRVYGIIMIGHLSDMEHAVGADHLIYGWFFFAFVLVVLFLIGEAIRKVELKKLSKLPDPPSKPSTLQGSPYSGSSLGPTSCVLLILFFASGLIKIHSLDEPQNNAKHYSSYMFEMNQTKHNGRSRVLWEPDYDKAMAKYQQSYMLNGTEVVNYVALFSTSDGEIVRNQDRLYNQERWTIASKRSVQLHDGLLFNVDNVVSVTNASMEIYSAYLIDNRLFTSKAKAKLYETWAKLKNGSASGALLAVAVIRDGKQGELSDEQKEHIINFVDKVQEAMKDGKS
ncbi:exosortase A [Agaribacter marinus]|uniref:Exosortase A n=1 Tax=Agaribacter marinus TaxID=1431249 RepID=A0AA37WIF3_9ALTE|nr:exosortase A [Agaribacter marinus]GLR70938.1 exosortase A [Agaribacter marinus]